MMPVSFNHWLLLSPVMQFVWFEVGFEKQYVADFVQQERRDMDGERSSFHLPEQTTGLGKQFLVFGLHPLDENGCVNDDCPGHGGYLGSSE
jgi:hypothetical protein